MQLGVSVPLDAQALASVDHPDLCMTLAHNRNNGLDLSKKPLRATPHIGDIEDIGGCMNK